MRKQITTTIEEKILKAAKRLAINENAQLNDVIELALTEILNKAMCERFLDVKNQLKERAEWNYDI